jgi:hypothetical protein
MIERHFALLLLPQAGFAQTPLAADAGTLNACCKLVNPISWKEFFPVKFVMCEPPLVTISIDDPQ